MDSNMCTCEGDRHYVYVKRTMCTCGGHLRTHNSGIMCTYGKNFFYEKSQKKIFFFQIKSDRH
jgi:hypothetical protein